jgi:hypothetical protein
MQNEFNVNVQSGLSPVEKYQKFMLAIPYIFKNEIRAVHSMKDDELRRRRRCDREIGCCGIASGLYAEGAV